MYIAQNYYFSVLIECTQHESWFLFTADEVDPLMLSIGVGF